MFGRRQLLLVSVSTIALWLAQSASAFVPALLAALAAITALAIATGKAAEAIEAAVNDGQKLWMVIASIPEREAARRELAERQETLHSEMGIRRDVVKQAAQSQSVNAAVVTSVRRYLIDRTDSAWDSVVPAMNRAASALGSMAAVFRERAVWFPAVAQDSLAELPRLYEVRGLIISKLQSLSEDGPPRSDEDLGAWARLVDSYDQLRVQSLKLITALDTYMS